MLLYRFMNTADGCYGTNVYGGNVNNISFQNELKFPTKVTFTNKKFSAFISTTPTVWYVLNKMSYVKSTSGSYTLSSIHRKVS